MWHIIPHPVADCCNRLGAAGFTAYPVGGCVRDILLGRTPGDWDIATAALPEAVMALFEKTVPTGLKHGTVTVLLEGMALEVTTFRREGRYSDGRRPDRVSFHATLLNDLSRRDFTVNAMALGPDGAFIDPHGGRGDLQRRLLRCVGDPDTRFREDALRMLRAVRFSAQLAFEIEEKTMAALCRNAALTDALSGERVRVELEKILLSQRPECAALPVSLGMLARFGAPAQGCELEHLGSLPPVAALRWSAFCTATGLDIALLPVERSLRRAVLHPPEETSPALTGGALYRIGYRGGEIGALRRRLLAHVQAHPEDNKEERLTALCREWTEEERGFFKM